MISTLMGLAECVLFCYVATMSDLKFIVKMVKNLFLAADLGHISRVRSRGPGHGFGFPISQAGLARLLKKSRIWKFRQFVNSANCRIS